ncbi:uncharacterized protein JCM6883_007294 [Sporobolomyces salmoneus]|uniref:uncharacterized protein n=1 Tax=Sporobolomyces salmoneus TaxID=183962 RepID=UPI00316FCC5F
MRLLDPCIPLLLLSLLPSCLASLSIVDLLSSSPSHSLLLRAFQRARLIPILNQLNESTIFAPTNEAIRRAQEGERAIESSWGSLLLSEEEEEEEEEDLGKGHDNLQLELRETLLYHCLNYTLFPARNHSSSSNFSDSSSNWRESDSPLPLNVVTLQESLYYPSLSPYNDSFPHPPSLPGSPPDDKPKFPMEPPKNGLLKRQGQMMRVVRKEGGDEKEGVWVGTDWKGEGGVRVLMPRKGEEFKRPRNGVLVPIDGVLSKPKDLASIIQSTPSLSTFSSLLPPSLLSYLSNTSHLTLFAPTNEAWDSLSELEMRYLRSKFSELDMKEILQDSASRKVSNGEEKGSVVGYLGKLVEGGKDGEEGKLVKTLRNGSLEIGRNEEGNYKVNGTEVEEGDILAKNGVLHTIPSLLLPSGSLALTAEKYLLALNCTKFVDLLHSVNLTKYVTIPSDQGTEIVPEPLPHYTLPAQSDQISFQKEEKGLKEGYTILALKDSLLASIDPASSSSLRLLTLPQFPSPGSNELRSLLSYHLLPTKYLPRDLNDGMLLGTELRPRTLGGARQRLMVNVQDEEGGEGEGWEKRTGKKVDKGGGEEKEVIISFGNSNAIAEPVEVGNSIIYLISTILEPPVSIISTAVSDLRLSTFIASVYSACLSHLFLSTPSITYLIPTNSAFERLGLVMNYLLLPIAKKELDSTLRYHALKELVYSTDFPEVDRESMKYPTLEQGGSEIYLERNSTNVLVHGPTVSLGGGGNARIPVNGDTRKGKLIEMDYLTETGVIHVVDQVELPPTVEITVDKLLKGAKSTTMVELIKQANMSWVLEGRQSPDHNEAEEEEEDDRGRKRAYTILCPSDKALSRLNLTFYSTHPEHLSALIKLHIIPIDALPLSLSTTPSSDSSKGRESQEEGTPLPFSDSIIYSTLHSIEEGGKSKYGKIAFKRWGTERGSWMVGIEGARGTKGESDSARVVNWGRATPRILRDETGDLLDGMRVATGGGVILIDSVLLPWEPGWFRRWGWIVLTSIVATVVVVGLGVWGVRKWKKRLRKNGEGYERVEGEED